MRQDEFINCKDQCGIYQITNLINGHIYIGQTRRSFVERWREHIKAAQYTNNEDYWFPIHAAMRKYGINNFDFRVLEICTIDMLDSRERFWINSLHATEHDNYNCLAGGQNNRTDDLEKWQAIIADILSSKDSLVVIANRHSVPVHTVYDINTGTRHRCDGYDYPLRHGYNITGIDEIVSLLTSTDLTFQQIADQTGTSLSKVKRVNKGEGNYHIEGCSYPLRSPLTMTENTWQSIVNDLCDTTLSLSEIATKHQVSYDTIRKTNNGTRNYHEGVEYPIRK